MITTLLFIILSLLLFFIYLFVVQLRSLRRRFETLTETISKSPLMPSQSEKMPNMLKVIFKNRTIQVPDSITRETLHHAVSSVWPEVARLNPVRIGDEIHYFENQSKF